MRFIYFVGTAGSGKSTLVKAYKEWLENSGIDSIIINLDPGVDELPYEADVDIREWISLDEVMQEYGLGPNGAQVVAADLMAVNIRKMTEIIEPVKTTYVLVDTPGQLELFAFRESSKTIVEAFGADRSMVLYLSDPLLCKTSNGFVSNMVLSSLVQFRLGLPTLNLLTKSDLITPGDKDMMLNWYCEPNALYDDLLDNDSNPQTVVGTELFKALENVGIFGEMRSVSSKTGDGIADIYAVCQMEFFGGEDPEYIAEEDQERL